MAENELRVLQRARALMTNLVTAFVNAPGALRKTVGVKMFERAETIVYDIRVANTLELGSDERIGLQEDAVRQLDMMRDELKSFCRAMMLGTAVEQNLLSNVDEQERQVRNWIESDAKRILSFRKNKVLVYREEVENLTKTIGRLKSYAAEHPSEKTASALMQAESRLRFMTAIRDDAQKSYDAMMERLYHIQNAVGKDDTELNDVLDEMRKAGVDLPKPPSKNVLREISTRMEAEGKSAAEIKKYPWSEK